MRELQIEVFNEGDHALDPGTEDLAEWKALHPAKRIKSAIMCEFELAEEVIALLEYTESDIGLFKIEVGIGESLRPYQRMYWGISMTEAKETFWELVRTHAFLGDEDL